MGDKSVATDDYFSRDLGYKLHFVQLQDWEELN